MLDSLRVLRDAAEAYRAAATAAGLTWPGQAGPARPHRGAGPAPSLVRRLFAVDQVPEQLTWLQAQGWDTERVFPNGGWLLPWPADAGGALANLSFAIGTPFLWRQQMPLFHFEIIVYTFVLAGDHQGEIWRYEASPDKWDSVRAATSLAALFSQWTAGITSGVITYWDDLQELFARADEEGPFQLLADRADELGLDPLAFPVSVPPTWFPQLRERQRECGVDMECIERGADCQNDLLDAIGAVRDSLRG